MSQIEIQCRATCSYCGKQETYWAVASQLQTKTAQFLAVSDYDLPENWRRGRRYMSNVVTAECEKCQTEPHY